MSKISQSSIEEIKQNLKLSDVIAETVPLTRRGTSLIGLCPFHSEKTASFHVNESENFYHCFGCSESGNVISWFMKTQGLSFPAALEFIAEKYGIKLKYEGPENTNKKQIDKKVYYNINLLAYKYFREQLNRNEKILKEYLNKRSLTQEVCDYFGIGFATNEWRQLTDFLKSKGFDDNQILTSGLARRNSKGELYDTFRGRLIFPIWIDARRISAFGGRVVPNLYPNTDSDNIPKYINSPESPVYHKSSVFYALPQANNSIRSTKSALIVEGYLDVISLHKVGVSNAIATCGTALTIEHVKRLKGLTNNVYLLFDGDSAGRQAAARSFKTFINSGLDASALFLPKEHDPDSIANQEQENTLSYIAKLPKKTLLACYIDDVIDEQIQNDVERSELGKESAFLLKIEESEMLRMIGDNKSKSTPSISVNLYNKDANEPNVLKNTFKLENSNKYEREILASVMALKEELPKVVFNDPILVEELHPAILEFISELENIISENSSDNEKKLKIKEGLTKRGNDWLTLWKDAYHMSLHRDVNMKKVFNECRLAFRKKRVESALKIAQDQINATADQELKAFLVAQRIELLKRSKQTENIDI
jgi:DNA primase catalytic core